MADAPSLYAYAAITPAGERVHGQVSARSQSLAFEELHRDGLSPLWLKPAAARSSGDKSRRAAISDRQAAELFASLATLLAAGADIRTALNLLAARPSSKAALALCRGLLADVSGGGEIDEILDRYLSRRQAFVAALLAAAKASGDLASGFKRAADMLADRCRLRDQLVSILSYPSFVLVSTVFATFAILLFVVPTLAPLVQDAGTTPPAALHILLTLSSTLQAHGSLLVIGGVAVFAGLSILHRLGLLNASIDAFMLDGPLGHIRTRLVYGAFSVALGEMLAAGAPLSDALKLAIRTAGSPLAQQRLQEALIEIRQGASLSSTLGRVSKFPPTIIRLSAVGESSGSLGQMLTRAGRMEEEAAMRNIEQVGRLVGPAVIIMLGGLVGLLMATLLSGVSQIGQGALQ